MSYKKKNTLSLSSFVVAQFIVVTDDDHYCCLLQMPEEEAFAVFVRLMQEYRMRDMFKPTMAELGLCIYQLENLVQVTLWVLYTCVTYSYETVMLIKSKL